MINAYHFSENPIDDSDDQCRILKIWVNSISKMGGISLIANIINNP